MTQTAKMQWLVWGAAYGALWVLAPGFLRELMRTPGEAATVLFGEFITGILVGGALALVHARSRLWQALLPGVLSLSLGARPFAFILSCVLSLMPKANASPLHRAVISKTTILP